MGRFTKRVIGGLTAALLIVGGAFAQAGQSSVLADFENGTNENLFGDYWYFYGDEKENGTSGDPVIGPVKTVHSKVATAEYVGDEVRFTSASIATGSDVQFGSNAAKMQYTFGGSMGMAWKSPPPTSCTTFGPDGCYRFQQFVGIGTGLVADGVSDAPTGFNNATKITFYAKAAKAMTVALLPQMSTILDNAHYRQNFDITTAWAKYEVDLGAATELSQPEDWGTEVPFNKTKVTKLAWQVQAGNGLNPAPEDAQGESNTLFLDDVVIEGFKFVAADMCESCVTTTGWTGGTPFSDFDNPEYPFQNKLGWYWYSYDDTKTTVDAGSPAGNTVITDGIDCDSEFATDGCPLAVVEPGAAYIAFEMGNAMMIGGNPVQPFVGLGTDLFDAENLTGYFNKGVVAEGIYFEYETGGSVHEINVEVQDMIDVEGERPESAVRYIKLPATNGTRSAARIRWTDLKLHENWDDVKQWISQNPQLVPLRTDRLAKIQFKYQGGGSGYMIVDNVRFLGTFNYDDEGSVRLIGSKAKASGLRATYSRGVVGVNWNAAASVASGKISLINTRGRVVSSAPIANVSGSRVTANLGKGNIPTGMYFVRVDAKDVNGKRIVQQVPVSIVK
ncbi:MAG: T9SS type A sorting domain-containing protein [Chitinispirillia bacterium]|nr:T9SS type A sorting domain-containing protein [Chitinispirillia bacterium]MCL2268892.1 T9SS type A sorting domain-containing protein [Chitinispirillia bacterium]